jgi:predicted RNase H-like nuclease (RuvC/YqgF family)
MTDKPLIQSIDDTAPKPDTSDIPEASKEFFEKAKLVEPPAKPKRHHPTVAELRALQARVEALEVRRISLEAQVREQERTIGQFVLSNDRIKALLAERSALLAKLQAEQREQGYWESQWRNEAAAREWAEAKLYVSHWPCALIGGHAAIWAARKAKADGNSQPENETAVPSSPNFLLAESITH